MGVVNAHGDLSLMPSVGQGRRSLVRENAPRQSSSGTGKQSHVISEPDLHESLAAFAEFQQPPVSLLSAQAMLADECKAQKAKAVGALATKAGKANDEERRPKASKGKKGKTGKKGKKGT